MSLQEWDKDTKVAHFHRLVKALHFYDTMLRSRRAMANERGIHLCNVEKSLSFYFTSVKRGRREYLFC